MPDTQPEKEDTKLAELESQSLEPGPIDEDLSSDSDIDVLEVDIREYQAGAQNESLKSMEASRQRIMENKEYALSGDLPTSVAPDAPESVTPEVPPPPVKEEEGPAERRRRPEVRAEHLEDPSQSAAASYAARTRGAQRRPASAERIDREIEVDNRSQVDNHPQADNRPQVPQRRDPRDRRRRDEARRGDDRSSISFHLDQIGLADLREYFISAVRRNQEMDSYMRHLIHDMELMQKDLAAKDVLLDQTRNLLETRTTELKAAQTFLMTEDKFSGAEVVRMVEALNLEIYQTAASMADSLQYAAWEAGDEELEKERAHAKKRTSDMLGDKMLSLLLTNQADEDPESLIQSSLQACLVGSCLYIIKLWSLDTTSSHLFSNLYEKIMKTELPAVSGRWRIMTKSKAKYGDTPSADLEPQVAAALLDPLISVLLTAGWTIAPSAAKAEMEQKFWGKLLTISKLMIQVDKTIGEGVISQELQVFAARAGDAFNSDFMVNTYEEYVSKKKSKKKSVGTVVCTCDIGVQALVRGTSAVGDVLAQRTILLKTKVVLDTAFN